MYFGIWNVEYVKWRPVFALFSYFVAQHLIVDVFQPWHFVARPIGFPTNLCCHGSGARRKNPIEMNFASQSSLAEST